MGKELIKLRMLLYLLSHYVGLFLTFNLSFRRLIFAIKKQVLQSTFFKDAKYVNVKGKIFLNPFAPYFPGKYFKKVLNNNSFRDYPLKPLYAQISITNICPCECFHCHVKNTQIREDDLSKSTILEAINDIINADFPVIFFVGGEPMSRFDDLVDFIKAAKKGMDTRIFTSGVGVTSERLEILKEAGLEGICVSLDHYDEQIHNRQRNNEKAFRSACFSITEASKKGFYVSAVCCTTGKMVRSGEFKKVVDLAESLGSHSIQINEIRPVGRAQESKDSDIFLNKDDKENLIHYYKEQNKSKRKIAIVMPWYNEDPSMFGCTATSGQNVYINSSGYVQPCVLLDVSLGNIKEKPFKEIWNSFTPMCKHPVRECIVHALGERIYSSESKLLSERETKELWPSLSEMEPADAYKDYQEL